MKRTISLVLVLALCLGLYACGSGSEDVYSETVYNIGDTVKTDMVEIQLKNVIYDYQYPQPHDDLLPPAEKTFIQVNFSIKNIGKTTVKQLPAKDGESLSTQNSVWLDYNDGYIFMINKDGITSPSTLNVGFLFIEIFLHENFCMYRMMLGKQLSSVLYQMKW